MEALPDQIAEKTEGRLGAASQLAGSDMLYASLLQSTYGG